MANECRTSMAERFFEEHCDSWEESGYELTDFRKSHHPDDLNLQGECGAVKLSLPDDERHFLMFRDGSFIFYDDGGDSIMTHSAHELTGVLRQLVETELEYLSDAQATWVDTQKDIR